MSLLFCPFSSFIFLLFRVKQAHWAHCWKQGLVNHGSESSKMWRWVRYGYACCQTCVCVSEASLFSAPALTCFYVIIYVATMTNMGIVKVYTWFNQQSLSGGKWWCHIVCVLVNFLCSDSTKHISFLDNRGHFQLLLLWWDPDLNNKYDMWPVTKKIPLLKFCTRPI